MKLMKISTLFLPSRCQNVLFPPLTSFTPFPWASSCTHHIHPYMQPSCEPQSSELQTQSALWPTGFKCAANYYCLLTVIASALPGIWSGGLVLNFHWNKWTNWQPDSDVAPHSPCSPVFPVNVQWSNYRQILVMATVDHSWYHLWKALKIVS